MLAAEKVDQPLRNVQVGWKISGLGQDEVALGLQAECAGQQFEEVDRGAVCDHDLTAGCPDQPRDLVADAMRRVNPVRGVPATDEAVAPFVRGNLIQTGDRSTRQGAKRVPVEGNQTVWKGQFVSKRGE